MAGGPGNPSNPNSNAGVCPTNSTASCGQPTDDTKVYTITLVPRSKAGVSFNSPPRLDPSYLARVVPVGFFGFVSGYCVPEFRPTDCTIGPPNALKAIETRFYIDLAKPGGSLVAKRRITAAVTENGKPASGKSVKWELVSGSSDLSFENATTPVHGGLAEVTIKHPVKNVPKDQRALLIKATVLATGTPDPVFATVQLTITRNDDVSSLDEVMANPLREGEADAILVYQPSASAGVQSDAVGTPDDDEFLGLQHILNQVVSRHKGISSFSFLYQDGIYGEGTKKAVRQYLSNFKNIAPSDWPYTLTDIGIYDSLKEYVNKEYAPFTYEDGVIVDRRLLIGKRKDDTSGNIDGLYELKTGVVDKLIAGMKTKAEQYLNSDKFWLHRPMHNPYQEGDAPDQANNPGVVHTKQIVTVKDSAGGSPFTDDSGASITLPKGSRNAWLGDDTDTNGKTWRNIRLSATQDGWVPASAVDAFKDDRNKDDCNSGLFGGNGVAYSFGCKESPAEFKEQLNSNSPGPADVINWGEYTKGHKPGLTQDEQKDGGTENGHERDWTGIDCSGFCQHCVTAAIFPGGTRIVPQSILNALTDRGKHGTEVGASGSLDPSESARYARVLHYNKTNARKLWIRGGDIVATSGHIVWVAGGPDDTPDALNDKRDFDVYNAFGGTGTAAVQATQFVHKTIRMPFHWWSGAKLSDNAQIGRVYIWK